MCLCPRAAGDVPSLVSLYNWLRPAAELARFQHSLQLVVGRLTFRKELDTASSLVAQLEEKVGEGGRGRGGGGRGGGGRGGGRSRGYIVSVTIYVCVCVCVRVRERCLCVCVGVCTVVKVFIKIVFGEGCESPLSDCLPPPPPPPPQGLDMGETAYKKLLVALLVGHFHSDSGNEFMKVRIHLA